MIGLDTTVIVAHELGEVPLHDQVRKGVSNLLSLREPCFALAPQVIHEFLHVVTDPRRFEKPLTMLDALSRASVWWNATEVTRCSLNTQSMVLFAEWMETLRLGRKRILDTALAASYHRHGITRLATANPDDFAVFGVFSFEDWARY